MTTAGSVNLRVPLLMLAAFSLSACVSYEPAVLVPEITLSAEQVDLGNRTSNDNQALDFGVDVSRNESDSLFNVEVLPGVVVRQLVPGGPAASAGIQVGDVILRINDLDINQPDALAALEQQDDSGTSFDFVVQRDTTVFNASVTARRIADSTPPRELYRLDPVATRAGYDSTLVNIEGLGEIAAARVMELFPQSPLPAAGINVGDLILAVDDQYLNSAQDLVTRLNTDYQLGSKLTLTVYGDNRVERRQVTLWDPGRRISRISLGPVLHYESSLNPPGKSLSIVDLWLFSLYSFRQEQGERSHSLLGLFNFSSDYGELVEER